MIKEIIIPSSLKKKIHRFPKEIRKKFCWCMDMLLKDERHPSLRYRKIEGTDVYWEFSITMNYRGILRRKLDKAFLVGFGKHEDVF